MKTIKVEDYLDKRLKDPKKAAAYLNAVLEDGDMGAILVAMGDVARAHGMTALAKRSGLQREGIYKMLHKKGNPELISVLKVFKASGLQMSVRAA
jgi:probable addiction module antidote protein